jgi:Lamin Tail Domain
MNKPALFLAVLAASLVACSYDLGVPSGPGSGGGGASAGEFTVVVEPDASLDATPSVLQLRVDAPPLGTQAGRVAVASGELSPTLLRELETDQVSAALSARLVPVVSWFDDKGSLHVAPTVELAAGQLYTLALEDAAIGHSFTVAATPPAVLPRIWPPPGMAATAGLGVWCGPKPLEGMRAADVALEPIGVSGELSLGVEGVDPRCVSFEAAAPPRTNTPSVALPAVPGVEPIAGLDPRPLSKEAAPHAIAALGCVAGEISFGPACVRVLDDRLVGQSPAAPVLWAVRGAAIDVVTTTSASDPFVLTGLSPSTEISLAVSAIDTAGRISRSTFAAKTAAPMAHVILSEVLADPIGPEPAEEWVELFNDGDVAANLKGFVLVDLGGETPLPAAMLAPHAYALLVGDDYVANDGFDPLPAAGTLLLRVPRVGKSGLSNEGEPLTLKDAEGAVVSSITAAPKPKSGLSVSRLTPSAPDTPGSFVLTSPTPGAPNAAGAP